MGWLSLGFKMGFKGIIDNFEIFIRLPSVVSSEEEETPAYRG